MSSPFGFPVPQESKRIEGFVASIVRAAGARGVVVGVSGGIDSAVVASLCTRALGRQRVLGLLLPSKSTPSSDVRDAENLASKLGIRTESVEVSSIVRAIQRSTRKQGGRIAAANLQARARMMVLYYFSNTENLLVAGTGDRSEIELGFFTKFGDGGVDFLPIGHLYKTQVRELGTYLGVPSSIVAKPSSPNLWPGHRATDELPAEYAKLDLVLHYLLVKKLPRSGVARAAKVSLAVVDQVSRMHLATAHKRSLPLTLTHIDDSQYWDVAQNFRR